jgi:hypothetical protein
LPVNLLSQSDPLLACHFRSSSHPACCARTVGLQPANCTIWNSDCRLLRLVCFYMVPGTSDRKYNL